MAIVLINGMPGSGKTTLLNLIKENFNIISFSKDEFKSVLGKYIQGEGITWTNELGRSSYELFISLLNKVKLGKDLYVFESAFIPKYDNYNGPHCLDHF